MSNEEIIRILIQISDEYKAKANYYRAKQLEEIAERFR